MKRLTFLGYVVGANFWLTLVSQRRIRVIALLLLFYLFCCLFWVNRGGVFLQFLGCLGRALIAADFFLLLWVLLTLLNLRRLLFGRFEGLVDAVFCVENHSTAIHKEFYEFVIHHSFQNFLQVLVFVNHHGLRVLVLRRNPRGPRNEMG